MDQTVFLMCNTIVISSISFGRDVLINHCYFSWFSTTLFGITIFDISLIFLHHFQIIYTAVMNSSFCSCTKNLWKFKMSWIFLKFSSFLSYLSQNLSKKYSKTLWKKSTGRPVLSVLLNSRTSDFLAIFSSRCHPACYFTINFAKNSYRSVAKTKLHKQFVKAYPGTS